jgi:uncharacterized protein (DUF433 family)
MGYIDVVMDWRARLSWDPAVCHGQVCIKGTRIPVYIVLDNLAVGESVAAILASYPSLKAEVVQAALACAADLARDRGDRIEYR